MPTPVKLHQRPPTSVRARGLERPGDTGHTQIRVLDDPAPGLLDHSGGFSPFGAGYLIDWWIGGDDRWYFPSRESTIRQRRLGPGPIVETAMRIPSGDAIHRCYAVSGPKGPATVIEVENASPVPVALAIAVRPYDIDGTPVGEQSVVLDGQTIVIDGERALELPRAPNEAQADPTQDLFERIVKGNALTGPTFANGVGANIVVLYPLPHTATLRFVVPGPSGTAPQHLPEIERVQSGWTTLLDRSGRFVLPDAGIGERADSARLRVLAESPDLAHDVAELLPGSGRLLEALATSGSAQDCSYALAKLSQAFPVHLEHPPSAAAAIVRGASIAAAVLGDAEAAETLLEPLMQITHLVERSGDRGAASEALGGLAQLLRFVGQHDAAVGVSGSNPADWIASDVPAGLAALSELSEQASAAGAWGDDEAGPAARFWLGTRRQVIVDGWEVDGTPTIDLFPSFPTAWRGGNLEVHAAATMHGRMSFAIRWHGARPALLWERESLDSPRSIAAVRVRCPGLDPDWSTTEHRGETLLVGAADGLPPVPSEGDSFA